MSGLTDYPGQQIIATYYTAATVCMLNIRATISTLIILTPQMMSAKLHEQTTKNVRASDLLWLHVQFLTGAKVSLQLSLLLATANAATCVSHCASLELPIKHAKYRHKNMDHNQFQVWSITLRAVTHHTCTSASKYITCSDNWNIFCIFIGENTLNACYFVHLTIAIFGTPSW